MKLHIPLDSSMTPTLSNSLQLEKGCHLQRIELHPASLVLLNNNRPVD